MPITIQKLAGVLLLRQGPNHYTFGDPYDTLCVMVDRGGHLELHGMIGKPDFKFLRAHFAGRRFKWYRVRDGKKRHQEVYNKGDEA